MLPPTLVKLNNGTLVMFTYLTLLISHLWSLSVLDSQSQTMVVRIGDTVSLQCSNVTMVVGHTAWFKQVNGSEPVCISSMYEFNSTPDLHNGFERSHLEMFSNHTTIFLKITQVEVADCGLYFCGLYPHRHMFFVNATYLKIQEDDDGTMCLLPLAVILGVVTAVLMIVILILVLKIRRDSKTHNTGTMEDHKRFQQGDPDSLNYTALSFCQKRSRNKKTPKGQMMEMEPNVVYAATR
uniref:Immunoglobulin domain-containing protein n=1 Tax=Oncorhynchus kisutch TaxID=8019 RepID=A0A8C7CSX8_ONCKI